MIKEVQSKENKNRKLLFLVFGKQKIFLGIFYPKKKLFVTGRHRISHFVKNYRGYGINNELFTTYAKKITKFVIKRKTKVNTPGFKYRATRKVFNEFGIVDSLGETEEQIFLSRKYFREVPYSEKEEKQALERLKRK